MLVGRLVALDMGEMVSHPGLRQPVFTWFESARVAARHYLASPVAKETLYRRVADAAREDRDHALLVAVYLPAGDLASAEHHLEDWLWDVLPDGYDPVWGPLGALLPIELEEHLHLSYLRLRVDPREPRTRANNLAAAALADGISAHLSAAIDPWQRLARLALQAEVAQIRRDWTTVADSAVRVRSLAGDLLDGSFFGVAGRPTVSGLLMLAETVFRIGGSAQREYGERAGAFGERGPAGVPSSVWHVSVDDGHRRRDR